MNLDPRPELDRQAAAWLEDGPGTAPSGLLSTTLARSRDTQQRPAWLATALGTPTIGGRGATGLNELRPFLIVLAALLAAVVTLAIIGSGNQRPVTVLASLSPSSVPQTSPSPRESAAAPTPRASVASSSSEPDPTSPPPAPVTLHKLRLAMPSGWIVTAGSIRIEVTENSGLFRIKYEVDALAAGEQAWIPRPLEQGSSVQLRAGFWITGETFDDLVAALDTALPDAHRSRIRIDGQKAFRWAVPQRSVVLPLVDVAAVEWRGRFYVLFEQLPLDGDPGNTFEELLNAVTLL